VDIPMKNAVDAEDFIQHHKDGSIWAKGQVIGDVPTGYWEWFRKDGTIMRSGYFENGVPVAKWTTYDLKGAVYKVTDKKNGEREKKTTVKRD
jgi:antitoxin component YwqK of YwqJK toxin-antitoxin module